MCHSPVSRAEHHQGILSFFGEQSRTDCSKKRATVRQEVRPRQVACIHIRVLAGQPLGFSSP